MTITGRQSAIEGVGTADPAARGALVRSSAVVGAGTALSRVTGLLRVVALLYALGQTRLADAYMVANAMPNLVFELLLGGVLTATLVPVFVDRIDDGDDEATSAVVSTAMVALVVVSVVGFVAAPWIIDAFAGSLDAASAVEVEAYREVGTLLLRLFMPQIFFYGLMTIASALLSARRSFAVPAFAPVLNNVFVSVLFFALPTLMARDVNGATNLTDATGDHTLIWLLGAGTTAGVALMALATLPAVMRQRLGLRFRPGLGHPVVRSVLRLSGWTVGYVIANQLAIYVILRLASTQGGGDVTAYNVAFTFFHLPHGLFAVSIMTTFLPELTDAANRHDRAAFAERFGLGVRLMVLVILPATAGYLALANPIVDVLPVTLDAVVRTADVLAAFTPGLLGFSVYIFALRGFYARKDTRTPFYLHVGANLLNVALAVPFVAAWGVEGLAWSYSLAYTVAAVVALRSLHEATGDLGLTAAVGPIGQMVVAAVACGLVAWGVSEAAGHDPFVRLALAVPAGGLTYLAVLSAFGLDEVASARRIVLGTVATRNT